MRIASNGIEIEIEERGSGSDTLLCIMGFGAQMVVWPNGLLDQLADLGLRVIIFDNRDMGLSTWLNDAPSPNMGKSLLRALLRMEVKAPYDLSDMALDTVGILDELQIDSAHVMGVSMGGMIAQHLAIEHPTRVKSLTSIMSGPGSRRHMFGRSSPRALNAIMTPAPKSRDEASDINEGIFRVIGGDLPVDFDQVRHRAALAYDRGHNSAGVFRHWGAMCKSGSRLKQLRKLNLPTTVIHGTVDPLVPVRAGKATAAAIPDAKLVMIDGMGHDLAPGTWPTIVNEVGRMSAG